MYAESIAASLDCCLLYLVIS